MEHHGDAALGMPRFSFMRLPPIDNSPSGDRLEAGDHAKKRRFAAAGRTDKHDELAAADLQVDTADDLRGAEAL